MGEVLKKLMEEKFIVKAINGPRYVVGCHFQLEKSKLKQRTRVASAMIILPFAKIHWLMACFLRTQGIFLFPEIGRLSEQIRELREVIELSLTNPELFQCRDNTRTSKNLFVLWTTNYRKH